MQKALKKPCNWIIFLAPSLIAFIIVFVYPLIQGIYLSFMQFKTVQFTTFVGFDNYINAFKDSPNYPKFTDALLRTFGFTIVSVVTIIVFSFCLALLLTKGIKGTNAFRTIFFMPNLIGGIVLALVWCNIFDGILQKYGQSLVSDPRYGFWGLVIVMNWQMIGYMMIIFIAAIQSVPGELIEAAEMDGATKFQVLRKVTIPMVMPSITICVFLTLTNSLKLFDQNLALTGGAPDKKTSLMALDIYNTFYGSGGNQGQGQAKAVVFFLIVAIAGITQIVLTRRKEVEY